MRRQRLLRITINDESRLAECGSWLTTPLRLALTMGACAVALMAMGALAVLYTPLNKAVPGTLKKGERAGIELTLARLDSLQNTIETNQAYIANFRSALAGTIPAVAPDTLSGEASDIPLDSLLPASSLEESYVRSMQVQGRHTLAANVSLASEGMVFHFPATGGVTNMQTRDNRVLRLTLPRDATVTAVADGRVVGVTRSVREHGYAVWIQHDNGFMSKYSRLGVPLADQGSWVEGGEAVALQNRGAGVRGEIVEIEMWHDGQPINPSRYLPGQ